MSEVTTSSDNDDRGGQQSRGLPDTGNQGPYANIQRNTDYKGCNIKEVIERSPKFIVFISEPKETNADEPKVFSIECIADDSLQAQIDQKVYRRWGLIQSLPISDLEVKHQLAFLRMMGNALGSILSLDAAPAKTSIDRAEKYLTARTSETAKLWFIQSSTLTFVALLLAFVLVAWSRGDLNVPPTVSKSETAATEKAEDRTAATESVADLRTIAKVPFISAFFFGTIGALLSVLQRLGSFPSDPSAGRSIHYVDGSSRILLGGLFAIVGVLGFYANVFFGFIEPSSGTFGIVVCLIAAISGASERLVPSLITSFSDKAIADAKKEDAE